MNERDVTSSNQARATQHRVASGELARRSDVRVAAVDIGSNTVRLMIADVHRDLGTGRLTHHVVERRSTITRLAEGVDARSMLLPAPIARTRNALSEYRRAARENGAVFVLATATSAVRDADNGEAFLGEIEHGYAFRAELLSGSDEAVTTWRGVSSDDDTAQRAAHGNGWLIDIGGGSTEVLMTAAGTVTDHHSFQLGSVRITERFLHDDPPTETQLSAARTEIRRCLGEYFTADVARPHLAIGVAGTVTTAATVKLAMRDYDRGEIHGHVLTRDDVANVVERLASVDVERRAQIAGLVPARAPVIVGGLLVLQEAMTYFDIERLYVSDADILDGIVLMAGEIALREGIEELPDAFGHTMC